jgi:lysophospholipase L1-like esterase
MSQQQNPRAACTALLVDLPTRVSATGTSRTYLRYAALGDSVTYGIGDNASDGYRGWARLLADAIAGDHDMSFCNLARPGATAADARNEQLEDALGHRPHLASLVVGLNDTMRSTWNPDRIRADLLHCAERLTSQGAVLMTVRFHDHTQVFGLPQFLAGPMRARIQALNEIYDDVHDRFGGLRVDVDGQLPVDNRDSWSVDRLHPSELGHRALARAFATLLQESGLSFETPHLQPNGHKPGRTDNARWLLRQGLPWIGHRARDLGPALARTWLTVPDRARA